MLWWMCIALPGSASIGLAMKVAKMPWRSAVSRTVRLNRNTRSARSSAFAVGEVDLHLACAGFVDQRFDAQAVHVAEARQLHEERVEVVDRVDRVRLPPGLGFAGAAERRLQRLVRVLVARDQIELHLGGHHRLPAALLVQLRARGAARCAATAPPASRPTPRSRE